MIEPGRKFVQGLKKYRYSINAQEKETELNENITTAEYWEYDSRLGRRWNVDPVDKEWESPYLCFSGNPIVYVDIDGLDPEDPKGKKLEGVTVVCKIPKEGTHRINPKVLKSPTADDFKNIISNFSTVTPGGIKPPEKKEITNPFQQYHRASKYFDAGWYDMDIYELTTYDWDNGQVMGERDWLDKLGTQTEFNDYTPVKGGFGGRDWNGLQVNDNGFLTGNLFAGPSITKMGGNPIKAVRNVAVLNRLGKLMRSARRAATLNSIQNTKLKNIVDNMYRDVKNPTGNGSSTAAFRFTLRTGKLVGGSDHVIKTLDFRIALSRVLKQQLTTSDRKLASQILKDITNALKGN